MDIPPDFVDGLDTHMQVQLQQLWEELGPGYQSQVIAKVDSCSSDVRRQLIPFVITGDATQEFLNLLNENSVASEILDIFFMVHLRHIRLFFERRDDAEFDLGEPSY